MKMLAIASCCSLPTSVAPTPNNSELPVSVIGASEEAMRALWFGADVR